MALQILKIVISISTIFSSTLLLACDAHENEQKSEISPNLNEEQLQYCENAARSVFYKIVDNTVVARQVKKMRFKGDIKIYLSNKLDNIESFKPFVDSLSEFYPNKISIDGFNSNSKRTMRGIYVYTYSATGRANADFDLRALKNSHNFHSWGASIFSEYYIDKSFTHTKNIKPSYEHYWALDEMFIDPAKKFSTWKILRAPMIEYYREKNSGDIGVIDLVNCYINVDNRKLIDGMVKECLLRGFGFPSPSENASNKTILRHHTHENRHLLNSKNNYFDDVICMSILY